MRTAVIAVVLATLAVGPAHAVCRGDCGGNGEVTVNELILGVNIALGSAAVGACSAMDANNDGEVTINELISAVNTALNGCTTGSLAGAYAGSVTFDATHDGVMNLTATDNGQVTGTLVFANTRGGGSGAALSFTFPIAGTAVSLAGTYDTATGGFEVSGSFTDPDGHTVPVTVSGDLPGPTGSLPVNVYVGSDVFSSTLSAGMLPTPTVGPGPTPTPGPAGTQRIVFSASDLAAADIADIFVINTDGSGLTKIFHSPGYDTNPAWSPDGTRIAFSTPVKTGNGIAVMNADGSNKHDLTTEDSPLNANPAWSPDGTKIAFTVGRGDGVDVMNADGSGRHRLVTQTAGDAFGHLSWSPDGRRIALESTLPRGSGHDRVEIWVMDADGTNMVRLTTNDVEDHHPDWSPNGQKIVFGRAGIAAGIYSINPDGSGETRLITDPFTSGVPAPNWSRDGQQLAYGSLFGLKITNANGSGALTVANTQFVTDFDLK